MIKPQECFPQRLAALEKFIDGELAQRYMPHDSVNVVLKGATEELREQLARMYSEHWDVVHGYSHLTREHWMTFQEIWSEST